jgi:hypothetical protein
MYQVGSSGTVQVNSPTDWIRPTAAASASFDVMFSGPGALYQLGGPANTWLSLASDRSIGVQQLTPGSSGAIPVTVSIRYNGGPALASRAYTMTAVAL